MSDALENDEEFDIYAPGEDLLPAWFSARMSSDNWSFGLLLSNGWVMAINTITRFSQAADGTIWIDVEMAEERLGFWDGNLPKDTVIFRSPTTRTTASLNAAHVIAAFELADT